MRRRIVTAALSAIIAALVATSCGPLDEGPTPEELREEERNVRIVKQACREWWNGQRELKPDQAKICTDTGWGK